MASRLHRTLFAIILSAASALSINGLLASAALAADQSPADQTPSNQTRSYPLGDAGTLKLTVPAGWQQDMQSRGKGLPPTISFTPASGEDFQVMVTPIVPPQPGMTAPPLSAIRANLERSLPDVRPHAVERKIVIHKLHGKGVEGYYYSVTDKAPKPDEFRLMTQAEARTGNIVVVMTVLSNDTSGKVRAAALAVLKSAQHDATSQRIAVRKVADGYEVTVPASTLALTLAEPYLDQEKNPQGGAADNPRYFMFRDRAQGLAISGWFEPAASFPGLKPFWERETQAWQQHKLPAPENVAFKKIAGWDVIAYDIKMPVANATDGHMRAEWVQNGTWIDVHLSITASLPSDKVRDKLEQVLKHLHVELKKK